MATHLILAGFVLVAPLLVASPTSAVGETCDGRPATHVGTPGNDILRGTNDDDVMVGLDGNDTLYGFFGNDVICGDGGSDDLFGYEGDDRLFGGLDGVAVGDADEPGGGAVGDLISPGPGNDFIDPGVDDATLRAGGAIVDTLSYQHLATTGVRVDLTPVGGLGIAVKQGGTDRIVVSRLMAVSGTTGDDVLIGSPYTDVLAGRGGTDVIEGRSGDDTLHADGPEVVVDPALDGPDVVDGGPGDDWVHAGAAGGTARGGAGHDHVDVLPGSAPTAVFGEAGLDQIDARDVARVDIDGGEGDDAITFSLVPDGDIDVRGGPGSDGATVRHAEDAFPRGTTITLDQRRGVIRSATRLAEVGSLEHFSVKGGRLHWRYRGTDARDRVFLQGGLSLVARTYGGVDSAAGTRGRDLLDLGRGHDYAVGRQGRDTCIDAEEVRGCEVRR